MRLHEIITRVQRQFGDDVEAQITKEDIVRWVNDACLEIVIANNTNQGTHSGQSAVVAGKGVYGLPSDLFLLRAVRLNGRSLRHTTYEQLVEQLEQNEVTSTADMQFDVIGTPELYYVYAEQLYVYPAPSDSLGTVDIMYIKTPDKMIVDVLDKEPDIPQQYHPRIVEYCIAQAAELDDNIAQYQVKMQEFKDNLQGLKTNGEQPENDSYYPSITYVSSESNAWIY